MVHLKDTAVGANALNANTTGNYNNAFGSSCLASTKLQEHKIMLLGGSALRTNTKLVDKTQRWERVL